MKRMEKYWICDACALKRGWKSFKTGNTLVLGHCGWCDHLSEEALTPLRDLKNAGGLRADLVAAGTGEDA